MDILGLTSDEQQAILRVIASVLKLGNVTFSPVNNIDGSEGCVVDNEYGKSALAPPPSSSAVPSEPPSPSAPTGMTGRERSRAAYGYGRLIT